MDGLTDPIIHDSAVSAEGPTSLTDSKVIYLVDEKLVRHLGGPAVARAQVDMYRTAPDGSIDNLLNIVAFRRSIDG